MTFSSNSLSEVLRPHARVKFLGFESSGYQLQQAGWELSAQQYHSMRHAGIEVRLALFHRQAALQMLTQPLLWEFRNLERLVPEEMSFDVTCVAPQIEFRTIAEHGEIRPFRAVDMTPQFADFKSTRLTEICPFMPINETVDMYLEDKAVSELLELVKAKQVPVQDAIRKRNELREWRNKNIEFGNYNPRKEIRAQLIAV